jgi:Zn-finger nucleic acid-binding protein
MTGPAVGMPCPVCKVPLSMSDRQGVEIDYCPQCRGVWLDRGELDKIIERSLAADAPPPSAPPPPQYPQSAPPTSWDPRHDGHPKGYAKGYPKRRKSFLEELFD